MQNQASWQTHATLTCVPTTAGASGKQEIVKFIQKNPSLLSVLSSKNSLTLKQFEKADEGVWVKSRHESPSFISEELITKFQHSSEMHWLLPGVKPTDRRIVLPFVALTQLNQQGEILSLRFYWDQASVMRQIFLLPSQVSKLALSPSFPVTAQIVPVATQNAYLRLCYEHQNGSANALEKQLRGEECQFDRSLEDKPAAGSSHHVDQGSMTSLMAGQSEPELYRPGMKQFDVHQNNEPEHHVGKRQSSLSKVNNSNFSWEQSDVKEQSPQKKAHHAAETQNQIPHNTDHNKTAAHKMAARRNESHSDIFGTSGTESNKDAVTGKKPSSRVLNVPGGKSSFSFA